MKKYNYILVFLFAWLATSQAFSQGKIKNDNPIKSSSPAKIKAMAKQAEKIGDAYSALYYYQQYLDKKPKDMEALSHVASLYEITRDYGSASLAYNKLYKSNKLEYIDALYRRGLMQKMVGQYDSAKVSFERYKKAKGKAIDKKVKKQIKIDVLGCDSAQKYIEYPESIGVTNAGAIVNNPHVDFGPIPLDSTHIMFGSLTSDTIHFYDVSYDDKEVQPVRKFYTADKIGAEWLNKEPIDELNVDGVNMGKIVFSPVTQTYYFTKCEKDAQGKSNCELYSSKLKNGKIESPKKLAFPINMPGFTTTQPAISYNKVTKKERLYFVSDRVGGKGGLDIYYADYDNRKKVWKKVKNLGSRVNTTGTDCTPYYNDSTNTLYFSSDGFPSMGGLDVFKSNLDADNRRLAPVNMGAPINTSQDDLDFSILPNENRGFLVSNRPGGTPYMHETCCDDIFEFELIPEVPFTSDLDLLIANVDGDSLKNDIVILETYDKKSKKTKYDTLNLANGFEHLELEKDKKYNFSIKKEGYLPASFALDTKDIGNDEHLKKTITLVSEKKPFQSDLDVIIVGEDGTTLSDDELIVQTTDLNSNSITTDTFSLTNGTKHFALEKDKKYNFTVNKEGYLSTQKTINTSDLGEDEHLKETITLTKKVEAITQTVKFESDLDLIVSGQDGQHLPNDQLTIQKTNLVTGKKTVETIKLTDGTKHLDLEKNFKYDFLVEKEGYLPGQLTLNTKDMEANEHLNKTITLVKKKEVSTDIVFDSDMDLVIESQDGKHLSNDQLTIEKINVVTKKKTVETINLADGTKHIELEKGYNYNFIVEKEGYSTENFNLNTINMKGQEHIKKIVVLKPLVAAEVRRPTSLHLNYEFDKHLLTSSDKIEIDTTLIRYMRKYPNVKAIISSHTDSRGSELYNQLLSERRMGSVVDYLIANGIARNRFQAKGFGETKLMVKDTTPAGRYIISNCKLNRRTEVEIID